MVALMACAFAMTARYAFGVLSQLLPVLLKMPVLTATAILVTMDQRFYQLAPPGRLFFIMEATIGAYASGGLEEVPLRDRLLALGCLLACLIGSIYSPHALPLPSR